MELDIINIEGKKTGKKAKLDDTVFGIEPNDHAVYLDVKHHRANVRQGTHKSKERGEITGSRRKIKKQKGTGTARAGDIKNPIFRGGGRAFGPPPVSPGGWSTQSPLPPPKHAPATARPSTASRLQPGGW